VVLQTLYVDMLSQPARAVCLLCEAARVPYKTHLVSIKSGEHLSPEFAGAPSC
jgi:glutathione S-transferase